MTDAPNAGSPLPDCPPARIEEKGPTREGKLYTHPEILRVFNGGIQPAMQRRGFATFIASSARSLAEQSRAYQAYLQGKGGRAAPPGYSAHNYGLAIDVVIRAPNGSDPWAWAKTGAGKAAYHLLHQVAKHYGLENIAAVAPDDPFHLQAPNWRRLAGLSR